MIKNLASLAFILSLAIFATAFGACGPDCHCGCHEGKPCSCHQGQCGPDCHCGCHEGKPCSCHQGQCGPDCHCGCHEGKPCSCGPKDDWQSRTCYPGRVDYEFFCESCGYPLKYHHGTICQAPWLHFIDSCDCQYAHAIGLHGVWLPESQVLFRPFMADPREITSSAGWRLNDQALEKNVIDVSYADYLPIYRWCDVGAWGICGDLQFEVVGALWAVFDPLHDSSPLINADYYVGGHLDYIMDNFWSYRLRIFHISSHIGDEFLLNHPHFDRRNPSAEYVDFFASYDMTKDIRLYGGLGYVIAHDDSFKCARFYVEGGVETRLLEMGYTDCKNQLYGTPFFAMHFRWNKDCKHHIDSTYVLGWEWGKLCGLARRLRIFAEYHDGYSLEGQFAKVPTNYFSLRVSYGF